MGPVKPATDIRCACCCRERFANGLRIYGIDRDEQQEYAGRFCAYLGGATVPIRTLADAEHFCFTDVASPDVVVWDLHESDERDRGAIFATLKAHLVTGRTCSMGYMMPSFQLSASERLGCWPAATDTPCQGRRGSPDAPPGPAFGHGCLGRFCGRHVKIAGIGLRRCWLRERALGPARARGQVLHAGLPHSGARGGAFGAVTELALVAPSMAASPTACCTAKISPGGASSTPSLTP